MMFGVARTWRVSLILLIGVASVYEGLAESWDGEVELSITNQEDFKWSVLVEITNPNTKAAGGFLLRMALAHASYETIDIEDETSL